MSGVLKSVGWTVEGSSEIQDVSILVGSMRNLPPFIACKEQSPSRRTSHIGNAAERGTLGHAGKAGCSCGLLDTSREELP